MPHGNDQDAEHWASIVGDMIERSTATAPTQPGIYRMPCGACYVDFFVTADGKEHWLVPGDPRAYTRDTVAVERHGDHPWERMHTLTEAADQIQQLAAKTGSPVEEIVASLADRLAADRDRADDAEIARIVRERRSLDEVPLADVAERFGVDLNEI